MPDWGTIITLAVCAIGALLFLALVANAVDESDAFLKSYGEVKRKEQKRWLENQGFYGLGEPVHEAVAVDGPTAVEVADEV